LSNLKKVILLNINHHPIILTLEYANNLSLLDNVLNKLAEMGNINTLILFSLLSSGSQLLYFYHSHFTSFKNLIITSHNLKNVSNMIKSVLK